MSESVTDVFLAIAFIIGGMIALIAVSSIFVVVMAALAPILLMINVLDKRA